MTTAVIAFVIAFGLGSSVEHLAARSPCTAPSLAALPARIAVFGVLYAFWVAVWGRPILAGFSCVTTLAVLTEISRRKRGLVGEPLSFSDFGLIRLILRFPHLYYTGFLKHPLFLAASLLFLAGLGVWLWAEPVPPWLIGAVRPAILAGLALLIGVLWAAAPHDPLARMLGRLVPVPDPEAHVAGLGLLTTLLAYALRWRAEVARPVGLTGLAQLAAPVAPDHVVVVQLESFLDPVRFGLSEHGLPGFAKARELAAFHGPLRVPAHGAFTMRSEFAVLTGLSGAELGFRGFDPYLTARGPAPQTLASRLRERGVRTVFLHPFAAGFFGRDQVVPRLGFGSLVFEEGFSGAERFGPYVSDAAIADRILSELEAAAGHRTMVMAVTMENHGPWTADRLPDEPDPVRQYLRHLRNADAALASLISRLSARPERVLLCLFGDHPPILPGIVPSSSPETDYAVLVVGGDAEPGPPQAPRALAAHELGLLLQDLAGVRVSARPPPASEPDPLPSPDVSRYASGRL